MKTTISKWGNSLAFRIPKHIADRLQIQEGSSVDISVEWYTRGKGNQDRQTIRSQIFNQIEPDVITPFSLQLPTNAPPTYEGKLIRIVWEVKMTVYISGFLGRFGNQKQEYFASINVLPSHRKNILE